MTFGEKVTEVETFRLAWGYATEQFNKNKEQEIHEELRERMEERKRQYYEARQRLEDFVLSTPVPTE